LIAQVSDQLAPATVELAREMVDANEAPIALDMISEMLVEAQARIPVKVFDEMEDLAAGLGLASTVTGALTTSRCAR
jgi:hypothetical protein